MVMGDVNPGAEEIRVLMFGDCGSGGPEQKNIGEKSGSDLDNDDL